jgi:ankyrin repeat protein
LDFRDEYPKFCAIRTSLKTPQIDPSWVRNVLCLVLGTHLGYNDISKARGLLSTMEAHGFRFMVIGGTPQSDIQSGDGAEDTKFVSPAAALHPRCVPIVMADPLANAGLIGFCFFFGPVRQETRTAATPLPNDKMEYFRVSEANPGRDGVCSDNDCPCGFPGASIPRGTGYIYVSKAVVDFRRDARSEREAEEKVSRMQRTDAMVFLGQDVAVSTLMCEQGARKRGLDLKVAAADARHWWETGSVPLRATPLASEPSTSLPSLFSAAKNGETEIVETLLGLGADVEARDGEGGTPLIIAAYAGHNEVVDALLANGSDVNALDKQGSTAIMYAARNGHTLIVESLLAKGAEVNVQATNNGCTALVLAAAWGRTKIADALLERQAHANVQNKEGNTALICAAREGHREIVDKLLASDAEVSFQNGEGNTALILAASNGHCEIFESLLAKGAEVNVRNSEGATALILAARNGHRAIVDSLLANGAEVNVQATNNGNTALILAADFGHSEIVESLLAHEADVSAKNEKGDTALILAAGKEAHLEVVEKVLAAGADVNALNHDGTSALIMAASWGHKAIVDRLLASGADVSICDKDGDTAQKIAARNGYKDVVRSLKGWSGRASRPLAPAFEARAWTPTHLVPPGGMAAWDAPDPSRPPMAQLAEQLELVVEASAGAWAQVRAVNGWRGWVDSRLLYRR